MENLEKLAIELFKKKCILFGKFILTSGLESPYYIDLRSAPSHPKLFKLMIKAYHEILKGLNFNIIAGVATAGLPIASVLSYKMGKPLVYVRKEAKEHGTSRIVEGHFRKGMIAVVIDDVTSTGGSILRAVESLRNHGLKVYDAVVLVDREQGAYERLENVNVKLHYTFKVSKLAEILYREGLLSHDKYQKIVEYVRGWNIGV